MLLQSVVNLNLEPLMTHDAEPGLLNLTPKVFNPQYFGYLM